MKAGAMNPRLDSSMPIISEEEPLATLSPSTSEKHTELESANSTDTLLIRDDKNEESTNKTVIAPVSSAEGLKSENGFPENLNPQEIKESKTRPNNPVKARKRKKEN